MILPFPVLRLTQASAAEVPQLMMDRPTHVAMLCACLSQGKHAAQIWQLSQQM